MPTTNFPQGVSSFGLPIIGAGPVLTTGNVFFVNNSVVGASNGNPGTDPGRPLSTVAAALTKCTANQGDYILVGPGHAETLSTAGAITCSVAGVTILGLGNGSNRPTFSWGATAATWVVSAANVTISNIRCTPSIDEVVSMFSVSAANVTFDRVDHIDAGASLQTIQFMLTTAAADYLTIQNCKHLQLTAAAAAQKWIQLVGTDFTRIIDNTFFIVANAATASHLISGTTAVVYCEIARNNMLWIGATINTIVNLVTGSTGLIAYNNAGSGTSVATAGAFTGDGCFMFQNFWADTAAASGLLAPTVDTDT